MSLPADRPTQERPEQPRPGLLSEHGEPLKAPWEAQAFDVSVRQRTVVDREAELTALKGQVEALLGKITIVPDEVTDGVDAVEQAAARREHLLQLRRWTPKTEHVLQVIEQLERAIAESVERKKAVSPDTHRRLRQSQASLADCLERDQLLAERAEAHPGCVCLGLGGDGETRVALRHPPDPTVPHDSGRVYYSEADAPVTWARYCEHCPEGELEQQKGARAREEMRGRYAGRSADKLLGAAKLPEDYAGLTLATYPDQVLAARCGRWYTANIDGVEPEQRAPKVFLLLHGPNRRGKTGLACGICDLALSRGEQARFWSLKRLLDVLRATFDPQHPACHAELLQALYDVPLLVLDDLGAEKLSGWVEETLYGLLNERLIAGKLTVITSNLGWTDNATEDDRRLGIAAGHRVTPLNAKDWNPEELIRRVGERIWWRLRAGANQVAVIGPILGLDRPRRAAAAARAKSEELEAWT